MEPDQLARELEELQRTLASGPRFEPSNALRQRVLRGVRAELARDHVWPGWRFATAAAAAVFVWLSLSVAATQVINFALARPRSQQPVNELARQIQRRLPTLSPEESLREAILLQAGAEFGSPSCLTDRLCLDATGGLLGSQRTAPPESSESPPPACPPCDRQRPDERGGSPQSNGVLKAAENAYA